MDWEESHQRLLQGLSSEIRGRWGQISEIEERLGLSGGYLNKLCKGKHEFKLATFLKALAVVDVDPRAFFARQLEIHSGPVDFLEQLDDGDTSDRAFDRIARATLSLEGSKPPAADTVAIARASDVAEVVACSPAEQCRRLRSTRKYRTHAFARAYLEYLDALRYDHAPKAARLATAVASQLVPKLPGPDPERLSLQCLALGVFGSARRLKDQLAVSARAFRLALDVAGRSRLEQSRANLLIRASYLLKDFSHFDRALALLNEALVAFVRLGSQADIGRVLVDRGMMNCYAGNYEDAVLDLRQARVHLEGSAHEIPRYHLALYQFLAYAFEHLGDLEAAEECLAAGARSFGPEHEVDRAKLDWVRGSLAAKRGDGVLAEALLRSARAVLAARQHVAQEALVTLDLVNALLARNKPRDAADLATSMVRLLGASKKNPFVDAAVVELTSAALAGELSQDLIARARSKIEAGGRQPRPVRR